MKKDEEKVWNGVGTNWYLDDKGNPKGRFSSRKVSDFEFELIKKPGKVLEIGVGTGRDAKRFSELGSVISGIDISKTFIELVSNKIKGNFIVADVRDIDTVFKGEKFDLIYSRWSLIHLSTSELNDFLAKAYNLLNKDGELLVSLRYGFDYEQINSTTKIRSLQMNEEKLLEIIEGDEWVVSKSIIKEHESTESKNDKQYTFILRRPW